MQSGRAGNDKGNFFFFFSNAVTKHLKQAENGQTSLLCTHAASFRNAITLDKGDYCQV